MARDASARQRQARTMSVAEWCAMEEDEPGELVDGVLEEEEVPDFVHEVVVTSLAAALDAWSDPRGGFVGGSEAKFALGRGHGRKPDLSVFLGGRRPPPRGPVPIPPDVIIEVVTPTPRDGRRDRIEKMEEYAAFGVRHYWIVDPELRSLEVFELSRGRRYTRVLAATRGRVERVPGCEGLVLDLDALWRKVDRLLAKG